MKCLEVGDLVFIKRNNFFYKKIAETTNSWTSHVAIVYKKEGRDILLAESCFPFSKLSTFDDYIARSEDGVVCVKRLQDALNDEQKLAVKLAADKRIKKFYTWGYNYESKYQFCSKFVAEIYQEALAVTIGEQETFQDILDNSSSCSKSFWTKIFLGKLPLQRKTMTPYSIYVSDLLETLYDNFPSKGRFEEV